MLQMRPEQSENAPRTDSSRAPRSDLVENLHIPESHNAAVVAAVT